MLFAEVVGHKNIKDVLMRTVISSRVGHAYIFEGPLGIGKLNMAKAFAMTLLCNNAENGCACGVCKNCRMFLTGNHPDVQIVTNQLYDPSKKSTDILVDTVRNMKQEIYIKPYISDRKVYIIPKADTMNLYAQNSLLKVLEEPPEYCTIILIAENSNLFLPTILSRAPIFKFFPLKNQEIFEALKKRYPDIAEETLQMSANMCGGSLERAFDLAENTESCEIRNKTIELVLQLSKNHRKDIYELSNFLYKQSKDGWRLVYGIMQGLFKDLMFVKITDSCDNITNLDKSAPIKQLADSVSHTTPQKLLEILFKYDDYISKNISYAQIARCVSLELWEAINDRSYRSKI